MTIVPLKYGYNLIVSFDEQQLVLDALGLLVRSTQQVDPEKAESARYLFNLISGTPKSKVHE